MSNSSLVSVTILSPNNSGKRTHSIDRITPHCMAGHCTARNLGEWFSKESTKASSNYGVDDSGTVAMYVANLGIDVIDLGVPVLSMHAPYETTSKLDVYMCYRSMYEFMK